MERNPFAETGEPVRMNEQISPEVIAMYEIAGSDKITPQTYARYKRDHRQNKKIVSLTKKHVSARDAQLEKATVTELPKLIRECFAHEEDVSAREKCVYFIDHVLEEERVDLIRVGLGDRDPMVRMRCAEMIASVPEQAGVELIRKGFEDDDEGVRSTCAMIITRLSSITIEELIHTAFASTKKGEFQVTCAEYIKYIPEKDRGLLNEELISSIHAGFSGEDAEARRVSAKMIRYVPEDAMSELIREAFATGDEKAQVEAVGKIHLIPSADRAELLRWGLKQDRGKFQEECAAMIYKAPTEQVAGLIRLGFASQNINVWQHCASAIRYAAKEQRANLIHIGFEKNDDVTQYNCIEQMESFESFLTDEAISTLRIGLEKGGMRTRAYCAGFIRKIPSKARDELWQIFFDIIRRDIKNKDAETRRGAAAGIVLVPKIQQIGLKEELTAIIRADFQTGDAEARRSAALMISEASERDRAELIRLGFAGTDVEVQRACAEAIFYLPPGEMGSLIRVGLEKEDAETRKLCAFHIRIVSSHEVPEFIRMALTSDDMTVRRIGLSMLYYFPQPEKEELFQFARERFGDSLVDPPLYKGGDVPADAFARRPFTKSGSETTLLGGSLKGKAIIRTIRPKSFLAWQQVYDNHELWKKEGFDYVPIEPIISYRLNKNGMVDVFSGVLDLNTDAWIRMTDRYREEIEKAREKIKKILDRENVFHGHAHEENFCLRFFRDKNGHVDFSRQPRVYLIDFDQAVSPR